MTSVCIGWIGHHLTLLLCWHHLLHYDDVKFKMSYVSCDGSTSSYVVMNITFKIKLSKSNGARKRIKHDCLVRIENSIPRDLCFASLSKGLWCRTVTLGMEFSIRTSHSCKILVISLVAISKIPTPLLVFVAEQTDFSLNLIIQLCRQVFSWCGLDTFFDFLPRCSNCFDCPSCGHTLTTRATSQLVSNPDDPGKSTPKKMYYLACGFCRWTTRDVGIADKSQGMLNIPV